MGFIITSLQLRTMRVFLDAVRDPQGVERFCESVHANRACSCLLLVVVGLDISSCAMTTKERSWRKVV